MTTYYSASTGLFYSSELFGSKTKTIIDPEFEWPMVTLPDPNWAPPTDDPKATPPMIEVADPTVQPPLIEVPNPDCKLPHDAVAITQEEHQALLEGQGKQRIVSDENGKPVLAALEPETLEQLALQKRRQIYAASVKALSAVRNEYPDYEQLSWERQEREALEGGGPLIESIANARGLEIGELIERILEKSNLYQQAAGNVIGKRQALEDQIAAALVAEDRDALEDISW